MKRKMALAIGVLVLSAAPVFAQRIPAVAQPPIRLPDIDRLPQMAAVQRLPDPEVRQPSTVRSAGLAPETDAERRVREHQRLVENRPVLEMTSRVDFLKERMESARLETQVKAYEAGEEFIEAGNQVGKHLLERIAQSRGIPGARARRVTTPVDSAKRDYDEARQKYYRLQAEYEQEARRVESIERDAASEAPRTKVDFGDPCKFFNQGCKDPNYDGSKKR
jgi:hypothetical protein